LVCIILGIRSEPTCRRDSECEQQILRGRPLLQGRSKASFLPFKFAQAQTCTEGRACANFRFTPCGALPGKGVPCSAEHGSGPCPDTLRPLKRPAKLFYLAFQSKNACTFCGAGICFLFICFRQKRRGHRFRQIQRRLPSPSLRGEPRSA